MPGLQKPTAADVYFCWIGVLYRLSQYLAQLDSLVISVVRLAYLKRSIGLQKPRIWRGHGTERAELNNPRR